YVTFIFRLSGDPDRTLERWARMKRAASETIIRHGGTISHQHGIGTDHALYLGAEKGRLGITLLRDVMRSCDPDGILNPGKLLPTDGTLASPVVG
ncbi:MAG TPA: FAD-binding oxidoreductase, partial [Chloroflexi bacterium]|nr:FAD-binding oxidoreductase [Chloroflexota bacterium]